jgi:hypothetical protein
VVGLRSLGPTEISAGQSSRAGTLPLNCALFLNIKSAPAPENAVQPKLADIQLEFATVNSYRTSLNDAFPDSARSPLQDVEREITRTYVKRNLVQSTRNFTILYLTRITRPARYDKAIYFLSQCANLPALRIRLLFYLQLVTKLDDVAALEAITLPTA